MSGPLIHYQFDTATVNLVVEGLAELPYKRVANTIANITAHAAATLNPPPQPRPKRAKKPPAPAEGG